MDTRSRKIVARWLPGGLPQRVRQQQRRFRLYRPSEGRVQFGGLRRTMPISAVFGLDRGLPISRYYIEKFLDANRNDVRGRVLEFGDAYYAHKFGGDRVTKADVLNLVSGDPSAI